MSHIQEVGYSGRNIHLLATCQGCKQETYVTLDKKAYEDWLESGTHITEAVPGINADDAQLLQEGCCQQCADDEGVIYEEEA